MNNVKQNIKCSVKTCEYHDGTNGCNRDGIYVNCRDTDAPQNSGCTQCSSFCACR